MPLSGADQAHVGDVDVGAPVGIDIADDARGEDNRLFSPLGPCSCCRRAGPAVSAVGADQPMASLDELPPYRCAQLLWRWAHEGVAFVEHLVFDAATEPCSLPSPPPVTAIGSTSSVRA